ncbi:hypothetical protein JOB18_028204 [Solea senegalensis]|uniref:Uncharacterized protein n=1 Tax=Solea senegalensis TaxID=28829 RepID=A0AAV6PZ53_SOLSE|nr:hypothetical protein JOB18_028204 [Solea senegalensis]
MFTGTRRSSPAVRRRSLKMEKNPLHGAVCPHRVSNTSMDAAKHTVCLLTHATHTHARTRTQCLSYFIRKLFRLDQHFHNFAEHQYLIKAVVVIFRGAGPQLIRFPAVQTQTAVLRLCEKRECGGEVVAAVIWPRVSVCLPDTDCSSYKRCEVCENTRFSPLTLLLDVLLVSVALPPRCPSGDRYLSAEQRTQVNSNYKTGVANEYFMQPSFVPPH